MGDIEVMDIVYLNVSDLSGNMAAFQPLTVVIEADDNHAPDIIIGADMKVRIL